MLSKQIVYRCQYFDCCIFVILLAQINLADIYRIIPRERKLAPNLSLRNERIQLNGKAIGGSN